MKAYTPRIVYCWLCSGRIAVPDVTTRAITLPDGTLGIAHTRCADKYNTKPAPRKAAA